jgi:hypothetical protein
MTIYHCRCFVTFGHNALEGISEAVLPHVQKFLLRLTSELRDLSLQNTSQTCALSSDSDHHLQFHIHENIIFNFSVTVHKNARRIKFETASQQQRSFFCISVYSEKHTYMWIFSKIKSMHIREVQGSNFCRRPSVQTSLFASVFPFRFRNPSQKLVITSSYHDLSQSSWHLIYMCSAIIQWPYTNQETAKLGVLSLYVFIFKRQIRKLVFDSNFHILA